ncbi:hypothetical protein ACF0H5_013427 [Mactra antiquata]
MALKQAKSILRKELKSKLAAMTEEQRTLQSNLIFEKLLSMPEYKKSQRVCLYLHMKEEVQTFTILKHLLETNRECFIPHYKGPIMNMVKLNSLEDYESLPLTKWKIKQPADDDDRSDALETGGLDLILMPGLGFTLNGDRIGRGKGYYDTYLEKCRDKGFNPKTIALAYREQICVEIPVTDTDIKVDIVLHPDSD